MEEKSKKKVRLVRAYSGVQYGVQGELGVVRKVLYFWQCQVKADQKMKAPGRPKEGDVVPPVSKGNQIAELERLVGRQQLELSFFRGALQRVAALNPPPSAAWHHAIFAEIGQVMETPQGQPRLTIREMCGLVGVSRASYHRHQEESA